MQVRGSSPEFFRYCSTNSRTALTCAQFHPDGHLVACGGIDGQIKIFDVKSGTLAATFDATAGGPVRALFFSENGTWLASAGESSTSVSIWDLRKAAEIHTLEIGGRVDCLSWDYTGQFLLVGGPNGISVQQYSKASKEWSEIRKAAVPATGVAWTKAAREIVTVDQEGVVTSFLAKA